MMTSDPEAFVYSPGITNPSRYLDSDCSVIESQYAISRLAVGRVYVTCPRSRKAMAWIISKELFVREDLLATVAICHFSLSYQWELDGSSKDLHLQIWSDWSNQVLITMHSYLAVMFFTWIQISCVQQSSLLLIFCLNTVNVLLVLLNIKTLIYRKSTVVTIASSFICCRPWNESKSKCARLAVNLAVGVDIFLEMLSCQAVLASFLSPPPPHPPLLLSMSLLCFPLFRPPTIWTSKAC